MKMQLNFHKRTGLTSKYTLGKSDYNTGVVLYLKLRWCMFTITYLTKPRRLKRKTEWPVNAMK